MVFNNTWKNYQPAFQGINSNRDRTIWMVSQWIIHPFAPSSLKANQPRNLVTFV